MSKKRCAVRAIAGVGVAAVAVGLLAASASAHIDPDPPAVQAGMATTVTFSVEHGCGDSPTVNMQFKIPAGVTDAKAVAPAGWTGSQDATSVSFTGGSLDSHTPGDFEISFTAPASAGSIAWLIVQKCTVGEIDWFDPTVDGQPEPEHPAPVIKITAGPPTSDDLAVTPDAGDDAPTASVATSTAVTQTTVTSPASAVGNTPSTSATVTTPASVAPIRETNGSSHTGLIILVVALVVVVGGGVIVLTRNRASK